MIDCGALRPRNYFAQHNGLLFPAHCGIGRRRLSASEPAAVGAAAGRQIHVPLVAGSLDRTAWPQKGCWAARGALLVAHDQALFSVDPVDLLPLLLDILCHIDAGSRSRRRPRRPAMCPRNPSDARGDLPPSSLQSKPQFLKSLNPCGARQRSLTNIGIDEQVSIHAPYQGATPSL